MAFTFEIRHYCSTCGTIQQMIVVSLTNWVGVRCAGCGTDHEVESMIERAAA